MSTYNVARNMSMSVNLGEKKKKERKKQKSATRRKRRAMAGSVAFWVAS